MAKLIELQNIFGLVKHIPQCCVLDYGEGFIEAREKIRQWSERTESVS